MIKTDEDNLVLASSTDYVDDLNAQFYGRFPYPWRPAQFNYLLDPDFETVMLNQDLGDWQHRTIPTGAEDLGSRVRHQPGDLDGIEISNGGRHRLRPVGPIAGTGCQECSRVAAHQSGTQK